MQNQYILAMDEFISVSFDMIYIKFCDNGQCCYIYNMQCMLLFSLISIAVKYNINDIIKKTIMWKCVIDFSFKLKYMWSCAEQTPRVHYKNKSGIERRKPSATLNQWIQTSPITTKNFKNISGSRPSFQIVVTVICPRNYNYHVLVWLYNSC